MPANIEIKRYWDSRKTKMIEKSFEAFYESLDDFDKWLFDRTDQLTDYLD